jgi:hypothetical protein
MVQQCTKKLVGRPLFAVGPPYGFAFCRGKHTFQCRSLTGGTVVAWALHACHHLLAAIAAATVDAVAAAGVSCGS